MKNTSKKSKFVILPALATLVMTSVATVTGTAAWFTAARTTTVTTDAFASVKTTSSLTCSVQGLANSGIDTNEKDGIVKLADSNYKLTHGSYNAQANKSGKLYVAQLNDDANKDNAAVTGYRELGTAEAHSNTIQSGTETVTSNQWKQSENNWYGFAWKMTFTYTSSTFGDESNYLLFDVNSSSFKDADSNKDKVTALPGFRIAFMTGSKFLVVGGDEVTTHVTGTAKESIGNFVKTDATNANNENYACINDTTAKFNDDNKAITTSKLNLGEFTKPTAGTSSTLTVTCVAWYEGTDPYVADKITEKTDEHTSNEANIEMSSITSTLNFYTRAIHA